VSPVERDGGGRDGGGRDTDDGRSAPVGANTWGADTYGDPCRGCGFAWDINGDGADALVRGAPDRVAALFSQRGLPAPAAGQPEGDPARWSSVGYLLHTADNLRIWAERLVGLAGGDGGFTPYDQDELARVRHYDAVAPLAALWSLERATGDWFAALAVVGDRPGLALSSDERGRLDPLDCRRLLAHEVHHHVVDLQTLLDEGQPPS
jgi:hypothetical protein